MVAGFVTAEQPGRPWRSGLLVLCLWLGLQGAVRGQDTLYLSPDLILPPEHFGRVIALATDASGRLFVADNVSQQIYLFDAQGHALDTLGGHGEGPGEFKMGLWGLAYAPSTDVLYAFETISNRIHAWKLHPEVQFLETHTLPGPSGPIAGLLGIWAWGADSLIVQLLTIHKRGQLEQALWLYHWPSQQLSRLFTLATLETLNKGIAAGFLPFMPRTLVAIQAPFGIATLWTDSLSVHIRDLAGHRRSTRPLPLSHRTPISSKDREEAMARIRRLIPPGAPLKLPELPKRTYWPYVNALLMDAQGHIWVRLERGKQAPSRTIYWAEKLGFVVFAGAVELKTIQHGYAWGIQVDADGLTSVVRYRLPSR